ncbi:MAG: enolase [Lachnospiraceae bacterium]|nr:enolase [Lachnospiraceae bacterium]
MDTGTIGSVVGITVICYLAAMAVRATPLDRKWIPVICGGLGGLLGIVGFFTMAAYPAGDFLSAIAVGIVSGLAATGSHQVYKQVIGSKTDGQKGGGEG